MALIKVLLPRNRDVIIPSRTADILMDGGNGNAALLYIYILAHAGELDCDDAAKRLKITPDALLDALSSNRLTLCCL